MTPTKTVGVNLCIRLKPRTVLIVSDSEDFKTNNVKNMSCLFKYCKSLKEIKLTSFDTMNVLDFSSMFHNNVKLTNLDLSNFKTNNAIDMSKMFY